MKVLLTGANGFVGSHILDALRARDIPVVALLRPTARTTLLQHRLGELEIRHGSITEPASLLPAFQDVTHVVHCAGCTKALRLAAFREVNQQGTRNVVEAVNRQGGRVQRLVHISSVAAGRPALPDAPAREDDAPAPVSEYGRSKLAGEQEVRQGCRTEFVILRPPAVYGPRDTEFLALFRTVRRHLRPLVGGGPQVLSLVFVKDLAAAVAAGLTHPQAAGRTYNVAAPEPVTLRALVGEVAAQMKTWTVPLPVPFALAWLVCLFRDVVSRATRRASVLARQKYPELRAPGWVCDVTRLREELGLVCGTRPPEGLAATLAWYRENGWL